MKQKYLSLAFFAVIFASAFTSVAHAAQINASGVFGKYNFNGTPDYADIALPTTAQGLAGSQGPSCIMPQSNLLFVADTLDQRVLAYALNASDTPATSTAAYVLGQPNFTTSNPSTTQSGMSFPVGIACDPVNQRIFVSESLNNRVLVFNVATSTLVNGENASYVFGQASYTTNVATTTQSGLSQPQGLSYDASSDRLFVADNGNSRVLVFNATPATLIANGNGENAENVLGESGYTTNTGGTDQATMESPNGVAYDASNTRLFVADEGNNRIMVYLNMASGSVSSDEAATFFLGQTTSTNSNSGTSSSTFNQPADVSYDASSSRLFVADNQNERVMVFNVASGTVVTGEGASYVLGQASFTVHVATTTQSGLDSPGGVFFDPTSNNLFVGDFTNNRIMVFAGATSTIATDENASYEFGHVDMSGTLEYQAGATGNNPNPWNTYNPHAAVLDSVNHRLFVTDWTEQSPYRARVLVYQLTANNQPSSPEASYVLGWSSFWSSSGSFGTEARGMAYDSANQRLFVTAPTVNEVIVFNVATSTIANGEAPSFTITATSSQTTFSNPSGVAWDASSSRLFVADTGHNRVMVYSIPANATSGTGSVATFVLGQPNFTTTTGTTTQSGLNDSAFAVTNSFGYDQNPTYDSANSRLFVPDPGNNRVLVFNVPANATSGINGEPASYVFGQLNFTSSTSAETQSGLDAPYSVTYDPVWDRLFVGDSFNNRVMIFDATPSTLTANGNGENAENTLGTPTFTGSCATSFAQNGCGQSETGAYDSTDNTYFDLQWDPDRVMEFPMVHITSTSFPTSTLGTPYSQALTVTSTQGTSQSYGIYSGSLPAGLSLSSSTGVISGTPTVATTTSVTIEADDNFSTGPFFDRQTFIMTSDDASLTTITPTSTPSATNGVPYSEVFTESGGSAPYTWSITSGSLPAGLSLATSSTNATTSVSGTPTVTGTSTFTIQVESSGGATTTQAYSFTVNPSTTSTPPQSVSASAGNGSATISFSVPMSNGGSSILYYTATDNSGLFSASSTGSPITISNLANGQSYTFTVTATNGIGTSASSSASNSVTPTAAPSTPPVNVEVASGGGGYISSAPSTPVTTTATTSSTVTTTTTISPSSSLSAELASLESELASLEAQAQLAGETINPSTTGNPSSSSFAFTRNLSLWDTGSDVQALQQFLINHDAGPAAQKLKNHGTTETFAQLTFNALAEFQASVGIPATGYFGAMTRGYISSH